MFKVERSKSSLNKTALTYPCYYTVVGHFWHSCQTIEMTPIFEDIVTLLFLLKDKASKYAVFKI